MSFKSTKINFTLLKKIFQCSGEKKKMAKLCTVLKLYSVNAGLQFKISFNRAHSSVHNSKQYCILCTI